MRRISIIFSLAVFCLMNVQCSEKQLQPDNDLKSQNKLWLGWAPVEVDNSQVEFSSSGGIKVVSALNYSRWWINAGHEGIEWVDGDWKPINSVLSESTDGRDACTYDILNGGWYKACVPEKGRSNRLVIAVLPNLTGSMRVAYISMESGDVGTTITVIQH